MKGLILLLQANPLSEKTGLNRKRMKRGKVCERSNEKLLFPIWLTYLTDFIIW
jgi:hypothetical protein